jgi:hypothetical protein
METIVPKQHAVRVCVKVFAEPTAFQAVVVRIMAYCKTENAPGVGLLEFSNCHDIWDLLLAIGHLLYECILLRGNATAPTCVRQRTPLWLPYIWASQGRRFSKAPGNLHRIFALPPHRA